MSIFVNIMPLQTYINQQFNGTIWRLEIDEITETIFVEVRDSQGKKVSFGAIGLLNGAVLFKDITTPERWLTGIEAAYEGILLLHFYQTETGPAHKGLMAIDAATAKVLWSDYALTFDHLSVNGPIVYDARIHPRKLSLADIKTGATTRVYEPSIYQEMKNCVVLPDLISTGELPLNLLPVHPFGNSMHYLEHNNFRIVSLHALKGGRVNQYLFIFGEAGKIYDDILNTGIQKLQPEAFIFHKNRLIYIKNQSELKVLSL